MSGELDLDAVAKMPDAEVIATLSSLRGIGVWTAEMLLLFTLQRPDVLSYGDLGIHRGMRIAMRQHRKSLFLDGRRRCHTRSHRPSRRNTKMNGEQEKLIGREFRHFKGNLYRLEGFAKDSETLEEMVVYRALYGEHGLWVRPAKMFFETIERDGKRMKRFELLEETNAGEMQ